jgi:hypothetical protein
MPKLLPLRALSLLLLSCALTAHAQEPSAIAVTDLTLQQSVDSYLRQLEAKKQAQQAAATPPAATNAKPAAQAQKPAQPVADLPITKTDLQRFTVDIKGELLKSGAYRLLPNKGAASAGTETIAQINERIRQGLYPETDYVLFGTISYSNATMTSAPTGNKQITHTLSLDVVGEFSVINTKTGLVDIAFSSIGKGSDSSTTNIAGTVIALNKIKVLKDASQSLANAVSTELELQFTPEKVRTAAATATKSAQGEQFRILTIK